MLKDSELHNVFPLMTLEFTRSTLKLAATSPHEDIPAVAVKFWLCRNDDPVHCVAWRGLDNTGAVSSAHASFSQTKMWGTAAPSGRISSHTRGFVLFAARN